MKSYLITQNICLLTTITCLGFPYILAGYWPIVLVFLAMGAFWMILKNRSDFWLTSILLIIFLLAAVGIMANLSTPLMIIASAAALAWWDLTHFVQSIVIDQPPETRPLLERTHMQSLVLAISAGLILAFMSAYLNLQISFVGMVLLVVFTIGCLTYAVQSLVKKNI